MSQPPRQKKSILGPGGVVDTPPPSIYAKTTEEEAAPIIKEPNTPQAKKETQLGEQYTTEMEQAKYVSFEGPVQPQKHDRRHRQNYADRKRKVNLPVDERIYPYFNHYLNHGPGLSKGDRLDRMILEFLISKGYPIDPEVLDRPFREEDVPKP